MLIKIWNQPKCLAIDEWIKEIWCVYAMEYYSPLKKEILPFVVTRMDIMDFMLS